jgi:hypothetical protein
MTKQTNNKLIRPMKDHLLTAFRLGKVKRMIFYENFFFVELVASCTLNVKPPDT